MAPVSVSNKNSEKVWLNLYHPTHVSPRVIYKVGDKVRISKARRVFHKGYLPLWSKEIFTISKVLHTNPVTYRLLDYAGDDIKGTFYAAELQRVRVPEYYDIDTILKERTVNGVKQFFVSWTGYPSSFNSWITGKDLFKN